MCSAENTLTIVQLHCLHDNYILPMVALKLVSATFVVKNPMWKNNRHQYFRRRAKEYFLPPIFVSVFLVRSLYVTSVFNFVAKYTSWFYIPCKFILSIQQSTPISLSSCTDGCKPCQKSSSQRVYSSSNTWELIAVQHYCYKFLQQGWYLLLYYKQLSYC